MNFYVDHYFHIGYNHYVSGKPCQDYAISKQSNNMSCGIISDGCSTGGYTDVGARLISFITLDYFTKNNPVIDNMLKEKVCAYQMDELKYQKILLGLNYEDLLATCGYIFVSPNGELIININGDGIIAVKLKNGNLFYYRLDWTNNTPVYPLYYLSDTNYIIPNDFKLVITSNVYPEHIASVDEVKYGYSMGFLMSKYNIEYIAIFTDGICQIDQVDWKNAIRDFMNFKNGNGEFLKRKMIRQIKEYQKIGKGPLDDIAGAIVRIA